MGNLNQNLFNGAVILLVATLAAVLMRTVSPGGGLLSVALWAVFFVTLQCFPAKECAAKVQRLWKRG
ncbi:MAG: hypothetical protein H0T60_04155 [Acidobacteria bacterium]|nr:hypothetical protein [Acidobacteriota bacterium]